MEAQPDARIEESVQRLAEARVKVSVLDRDRALREWSVLGKILRPAVADSSGRLHISDVRAGIEDQSMLALLIWDPEGAEIYAVMVAEMFEFPHKKVFDITLCAAARPGTPWHNVFRAIAHIAKTMGANQLEINGRRGWRRYLEGAVEEAAVYIVDLDAGSGEGLEGAQA